jgi:hypothetical protein
MEPLFGGVAHADMQLRVGPLIGALGDICRQGAGFAVAAATVTWNAKSPAAPMKMITRAAHPYHWL